MKKHRKIIRTLAVFITTFYVLVVTGASGNQDYLSRVLIHKITSIFPAAAGHIEYAIYGAVLPLAILWIAVLRITHLSEEEKEIEYLKRSHDNKKTNKARLSPR